MLGAAVIVFREVLEAALIVGIVLAASAGAPRRGFWVWLGLLAESLAPGSLPCSLAPSPEPPPASARNC